MILRSTLAFALLLLFLTTVHCRQDKLIILEHDGKEKYLIVTWSPDNEGGTAGCEFFDDQTFIDEVLISFPEAEVHATTTEELKDILIDCAAVSMKRRRRKKRDYKSARMQERLIGARTKRQYDPEEEGNNADDTNYGDTAAGWNIIFPGTKWCGAGDIAKDYNDLGTHSDTDKCCRAHDLCDDIMEVGTGKHNLTNNSAFTKLSCKCDHDFYNCLEKVDSIISNKIGHMYFNLLRRDCYELDYPLTAKCKKFRSFLKITCMEYERNTKVPKVYQWKSAKFYKKLPLPGPISAEIPFF